jgi:hypothetical protein
VGLGTLDGPIMNQIARRIIGTEIAQFLIAPRGLHALPLLCAGTLAISLQYSPPPLLAAVIVGLAALEPQFNNILYRTPGEFPAMSLLPADQGRIVAAKNIATLILSGLIVPACATVLLFFSRSPAAAGDITDAILFQFSLVFPLLHSGNSRSLQYPRRNTGWQTDDLVEGSGFLLTMAAFSIPYLLLVTAWGQRPLCALYALATAMYWWRRSIPSTATRIDNERVSLCNRQ